MKLDKNDGWIEWGGGECPVDESIDVDIRFEDGSEKICVPADAFIWQHDDDITTIIAYRLHRDINSRANDDRLEQDLNECIGQDVDITEWNGDGLPPVGVECEWLASADHDWVAVTVLAYDGNDAWLKPSDGSQSFVVGNVAGFRPLRTEAEKARDEAVVEMCLRLGIDRIKAEKFYDIAYKIFAA